MSPEIKNCQAEIIGLYQRTRQALAGMSIDPVRELDRESERETRNPVWSTRTAAEIIHTATTLILEGQENPKNNP